MSKKEATREQKFEEYRKSIESDVSTSNIEKNLKPKKNKKPTLRPLILEYKKAKFKRYFLYYILVSLFAITAIIVLIYFGVKIYG